MSSELPDPKSIKELRSLLGTLNFVRRFVPEYAEVTAPLVKLTKKQSKQRREFEKHWGATQSEAVTRIKKLLSSPPVLHFPDYSKEFIVHVDASEAGVGAFLAQDANEGSDKPDLEIIAYVSKRFTKGQKHYSATMKRKSVVELSSLRNIGVRTFGANILNASPTTLLSRIYTICNTRPTCQHDGPLPCKVSILQSSISRENFT